MPEKQQSVFSGEADFEIQTRVAQLMQSRERVLVAIDGMCCAGKTTMSERLRQLLD